MKDKPVILVVDDQPQNIELLEAYLVPQGYEIVTAANGEEALRKLSDNQIDLMLLDVMMPGMDGFEVTRRVRKDNVHLLLPIILVTALRETEDRIKGIEAGCDNFISKPVDKMELLARVRSLLKVKAYNDLMSNYRKELESEVTRRTEELRNAFLFQQRLIDALPVPVFYKDSEGRYLGCNSSCEKFFRSKKEQTTGKSVYELFPKEIADLYHEKDLALLQNPGIQIYESVVKDTDGVVHNVIFHKATFSNMDGSVGGLIGAILDITDRKLMEERLKRQYDRLTALRAIDMAITASLDIRVTFSVFLEQVISNLYVDAADILLLNLQNYNKLTFAAGRGFRTNALRYTNLSIGAGYAGKVAKERKIICILDLEKEGQDLLAQSPELINEDFVTYHGVPLIAKGQVRGVLEIFNRTPMEPDQDWLDFLEALATQAAIAIDNAMLFDDLQKTNIDLIQAYDNTLEGWSNALDLRDKETEGHSQRVTEMTLRLARQMGLRDSELVHLRRGTLLHDIGKMGIPDAILLKPGPLNDEEREIMQKHPVYAYELLFPISYLRLALDIPYCHHEKWDGTGYPRGLKGKQIPLAARIFSVVDVWDALRSDRPYRPAWLEEKTRGYIKEQVGKQFDPKVVEAFLALLSGYMTERPVT